MPTATELKLGLPEPAPAEKLLFTVGLNLLLCQSHCVRPGITYKLLGERTVGLGCCLHNYAKGVRVCCQPGQPARRRARAPAGG